MKAGLFEGASPGFGGTERATELTVHPSEHAFYA
jgi:hypothetical protein